MTPNVKPYYELTRDELYAILELRAAVFVFEQQCPYQDLDGLDQAGLHVMFWRGDDLVAYARVLPPGQRYEDASSIGRVVTAQSVRGDGLGRQLMEAALATCAEAFPDASISISAQAYLQAFYESLGFIAEGGNYLEDGIPHLKMNRQATIHT